MTILLSEITFENDFFNVDLPDGSILTLNSINEDMAIEGAEVELNRVNIQITSVNEETGEKTYTPCPCVIGLGNDIFIIKTDYAEYEGEVLTSENMRYCTIEVYE